MTGLGRAIVTNLQNMGSGRRPVGASTITQQVAKNFLLSSDQTYDRKIKEAILAFRIEQAYSKDRILELYLNEIFFGLGAYGIAGAALTYFDKSVNELTVAEAAYLAALPKGPSNYHPFRHTERAIERRNWVIDQMVENGYVTREEGEKAKAEPLGVKPRRNGTYLFAGEYFTEEVRREIIARYGENALYEGGLSVRTTLDPEAAARSPARRCRTACSKYDTLRGYRGPVKHDRRSAPTGACRSARSSALDDVPEWQLAVVLERRRRRPVDRPAAEARDFRRARRPSAMTGTVTPGGHELRHAPRGRRQARQGELAGRRAEAGRRRLCRADGRHGGYQLRQLPEVSGGLVAMDPHTGRVLAMVGGFSYSAVRVQPRHAGDAPAGLVVQADRLCGRARQWLHAGLGHHGRADHRSRSGNDDLDAEEL